MQEETTLYESCSDIAVSLLQGE